MGTDRRNSGSYVDIRKSATITGGYDVSGIVDGVPVNYSLAHIGAENGVRARCLKVSKGHANMFREDIPIPEGLDLLGRINHVGAEFIKSVRDEVKGYIERISHNVEIRDATPRA